MSLNPPSGIVKWYNTPLGESGVNTFKAHLTGKDYPGASRKTSYVKLTDKEADEVISNMKKDSEGIPIFDESNAPDKAEEYQKWLVARYLTKPREESFKSKQKSILEEDDEEDEKIPEGLDELLGSVRKENKVAATVGGGNGGSGGGVTGSTAPPPPPSSSALATIPKESDDLVDEEIDSQILSILGLEDVFDLTYEEYASLLKEAAVKGRMPNSQMTTENIEIITNEFKRIKGKTGKFKVKPKKVNINKVLNLKPGATVKKVDSLKLEDQQLENTEEKSDSEDFNKDVNDGINKILGSLITIKSLLGNQSKIDKRTAETERRSEERSKKQSRENKLEKKKANKANKEKMPEVKPVGNFFDMIKRFFTNILIGGVVLKIFNWINDPNNKSSIERFKNFMVDNAPLILGGLLAIAVLPIVPTILSLTGAIISIAIPALKAAFAFLSTPGGLLALATIATKVRESKEINRLAEEESKRRGISKDEVLKERESARKNPTNVLGEALSSGGLSISGGGGISLAESMNVDPKAKRKPIPQLDPKQAKLVNRLIAIMRPGSGDRIMIHNGKPGGRIGTVVAGRNFFGMPETKYFDPSGNQLNKFQWAQRMADAGNPAGAKAAAGVDIKPTPKPKSSVQPEPEDPYAGADGLQRQLDDLAKAQPPAVQPRTPLMPGLPPSAAQPRTPLMPGLPPSAAQPGAGPAGNQVGSGSVVEYITGDATHPNFEYDGHGTTANYHDHIAFKTREDKERAKLALRQAGIQIGSENRPWDTDSYHGQGLAIDIPGAQWGGRGAIGETEYTGSRKVRAVLAAAGFSGAGLGNVGLSNAQPRPAQFARTPISPPSISSPTGRSGIGILPIPMGGGGSKGSTSGSGAGQTKLPFFSSEDPNNMTTMVVKGIYNVVG